MEVTLRGITNDDQDVSVDLFRTVTLPLLKNFGIDEGMELKIKKRGAPPKGGGEVFFRCPIVRQIKSIYLDEEGYIKRIRGLAYCTRVSPQMSNRMIDVARGLWNQFLPDVYIYSDHYRGTESGSSPGFALSLVAETTSGVLLGTECAAVNGQLPEDVATEACQSLFEEIQRVRY